MCKFKVLVRSLSVAAICMVFAFNGAAAEELRAVGKSSVKISGDENSAYKRALKNAKKDAVKELAVKVIGPSAKEDSTVAEALDTLADQLGDYFDDEDADTSDGTVEVKVTARIDAAEFRSLLREQGIKGSNTAAAAVKIAVMIDEYVTVPTDFLVLNRLKHSLILQKNRRFPTKALRLRLRSPPEMQRRATIRAWTRVLRKRQVFGRTNQSAHHPRLARAARTARLRPPTA